MSPASLSRNWLSICRVNLEVRLLQYFHFLFVCKTRQNISLKYVKIQMQWCNGKTIVHRLPVIPIIKGWLYFDHSLVEFISLTTKVWDQILVFDENLDKIFFAKFITPPQYVLISNLEQPIANFWHCNMMQSIAYTALLQPTIRIR